MTDEVPTAFFNHGGPTLAFEHNDITGAWGAFAQSFPTPTAIVVVSAHWFIQASAVTAMSSPRTVHDFFYGSDECNAFRYPAPGSPQLAQRIIDLAAPTWVGPDLDSWGLDHAAWTVLAHLYPRADVPVVELSVHASMPADYHLELGARLAPLRDEGVLVIGSGSIIHNRHIRTEEGRAAGEPARADAFAAAVAETMAFDPAKAAGLVQHPDYLIASPTPDHFLPLLYVAGLTAASGEVATAVAPGTRDHSYATGCPAS